MRARHLERFRSLHYSLSANEDRLCAQSSSGVLASTACKSPVDFQGAVWSQCSSAVRSVASRDTNMVWYGIR
eukprot:5093442-Pleurochrysis_carterae.AAC.1